jgi:hypothetical protein
MPESSWESLRLEFKQLRVDCAIDPPIATAGRLTAIWTAQPTSEQRRWRLNYWNAKDGSGIKERFKSRAKYAAAKRGFSGSGDDAVFYWLDQIKAYAPKAYIGVTTLRDGADGVDEVYSIEILDICGLSADYCWECEADEIRTRSPHVEPPELARSGILAHGTAPAATTDLELPSKFQNAFETARSKAELEYATRAQRFPNHPQFANSGLHLPLLIHTVFFEFCIQARNACRDREWTAAQVRRAVDVAWPAICDFYVVREHGGGSAEQKSTYRAIVWQTVTDDPRWKQHLADLASLGEIHSQQGPPAKATHTSDLSDLSPEANTRIERALTDAQAHLKGSIHAEDNDTAMIHYFDGMAWEYIVTRPAAAFEALVDRIGEKASAIFNGRPDVLSDRKQYWIAETRERAANGIEGEKLPVNVQPRQAPIFNELRGQFRGLLGAGRDLDAMFKDGGRSEISHRPGDPALDESLRRGFEQLARRAMATLGFRFAEPARAVKYWLDLLRQEVPHLNNCHLSRVCFESGKFCMELETRALEASSPENAIPERDAQQLSPRRGARGGTAAGPVPLFPKRAKWLSDRLRERSWNKHDLSRFGGPDHKTTQKVLDGFAIREDALAKVAEALSKRLGEVTVVEIPQD